MSSGTTPEGAPTAGPDPAGTDGAETLVELRDVSVRYGRHWALRHVDLEIVRGGHLALFGANGSGKSTLLRLIAGRVWPAPDAPGPGTAGGSLRRVYRLGYGEEHDAVTAKRRIRLVGPEMQDEFLARRPDADGRTVVATGFDGDFTLRRALPAAQERMVRKCLLRVAAAGCADRPFAQLSRGEQRRLLIARALVADPAVLCLDEICDGLDDAARERLLNLLDRLAGDGLTLVMATHRSGDLPVCVRRRLLLEEGRLAGRERIPGITDTQRGSGASRESGLKSRPLPAIAAGAAPTEGRPGRGRSNHVRPLVEVERADVWRGRRRVLAGLDWRLLPERHWRVTGPNGAGKSTFIKLLYGELRPAAGGCIRWFGLGPRVNIWAVRRRIGLVSDELQAVQSGGLSVRDCVATGFNASVGRVPAPDPGMAARVDRWLEIAGLRVKRDVPVRALSYGEMRRVLLARALVIEPVLLLLDEAASGLDAASRERFGETLRVAAGHGMQIVMAGHRLEDDPLFTDELRLAGPGRRAEVGVHGTPSRPATPVR